jgi:hypothetical protein
MNYSYSVLGASCRESMDMLTSNAKYLPQGDAIYEAVLTDMYQYPNMDKPYYMIKKEDEKETEKKEPYRYAMAGSRGCCGR